MPTWQEAVTLGHLEAKATGCFCHLYRLLYRSLTDGGVMFVAASNSHLVVEVLEA